MATLEPRTTPAADDRSTTRFAQDLWHDIERFDLADHVAELETKGLTVVPPGKAAPPELIERLRQACFRVARKRHGRDYDLDASAKAESSPTTTCWASGRSSARAWRSSRLPTRSRSRCTPTTT